MALSAYDVIQLLDAAAALTAKIIPLVQGAKETMSSDDRVVVDAALARLQEQNEADYQRAREALLNAAGTSALAPG